MKTSRWTGQSSERVGIYCRSVNLSLARSFVRPFCLRVAISSSPGALTDGRRSRKLPRGGGIRPRGYIYSCIRHRRLGRQPPISDRETAVECIWCVLIDVVRSRRIDWLTTSLRGPSTFPGIETQTRCISLWPHARSDTHLNTLKRSGVRWFHFEVFRAIQV